MFFNVFNFTFFQCYIFCRVVSFGSTVSDGYNPSTGQTTPNTVFEYDFSSHPNAVQNSPIGYAQPHASSNHLRSR